MARQGKPWFRASKHTWYLTLNGKKVSLGVQGEANEKQVVTAWHRLMGDMPLATPQKTAEPHEPLQAHPTPNVKPASVQCVLAAFLADAQSRVSAGCLRNYRLFLLPYAEKHGSRSAVAVTVSEAEVYARKPEWSASYRNGFLGALVTAYRWAERSQFIARSPWNGVRKPQKANRGAKVIVSAETHAVLVQHAPKPFRAFLELLWHTGAQPGEIAGLRAAEVDLAKAVIVLTEPVSRLRAVFPNRPTD